MELKKIHIFFSFHVTVVDDHTGPLRPRLYLHRKYVAAIQQPLISAAGTCSYEAHIPTPYLAFLGSVDVGARPKKCKERSAERWRMRELAEDAKLLSHEKEEMNFILTLVGSSTFF